MPTITEVLWADIAHIYEAILEHPFITGLTDGTLPRASFRHYIIQDAHYLRSYAKALSACAARAPEEDITVMFSESASRAIAAERNLHGTLLSDMGATRETAAHELVAPTTQAYMSYLLATTLGGSFPEALSAVLPCYWIYARVGEELVSRGSPDPLYARWIATYGGDEFQKVVETVLNVTDRIGESLSSAELTRMRQHFTTTSRYEWMFWDAAYRQERWPI